MVKRILLLCVACQDPPPEDFCGLPTELPDVADGKGEAQRSDDEEFQEQASWAPEIGGNKNTNLSVDIGTLTMIIAKEENGTDTADLVADGAFPICIPLGERSDSSGNATFDSNYISGADHEGSVSILDEEGGYLVGRFTIELRDNAGQDEDLSFTDGIFRAEKL